MVNSHAHAPCSGSAESMKQQAGGGLSVPFDCSLGWSGRRESNPRRVGKSHMLEPSSYTPTATSCRLERKDLLLLRCVPAFLITAAATKEFRGTEGFRFTAISCG